MTTTTRVDVRALGREASALVASGEYERALSLYASAFVLDGANLPYPIVMHCAELADQLGDHTSAAALMEYLHAYFQQRGDLRGQLHAALACVRAQVTLGALEHARLWWLSYVVELDPDHEEKPLGLISAVEVLLGPAASADARALARSEAARTLAYYDAARGRLERALISAQIALKVARSATPAARAWMVEGECSLFAAELAVDLGRFDEAFRMPSKLEGDLLQRWRLLQVRAYALRADFSEARELASALVREAKPGSPLHTRAVHALGWVLLALNRVDELFRLIDHTVQGWAEGDPRRTFLLQLRKLSAVRARIGEEEQPLPFVPQQVFDLPAMPRGGGKARTSLILQASSRALDRWGARANALMLALEHGGDAQAELALARAEAAGCDSPLVRAKQAHLEAMAAYHGADDDDPRRLEVIRGQAAQARAQAESCGLLLDAWQASRIETWCTRTSPQEHDAARLRTKLLMDQLERRLGAEDRVYFSLNKSSARDEYVSAAMREAREIERSRFPLRGVARWLERRRQRAQALAALEALTTLTQWYVEHGLDVSTYAVPGIPNPQAAVGGHQVKQWVSAQLAVHRSRKSRARKDASLVRTLRKDEALIQYYVAPDSTYLIVVTRQHASVLELPVTRVALDAKLFALHHTLQQEGDLLREQRYAELRRSTFGREQQLSDVSLQLGLPKIASLLPASVRTLYIVPHDVLTNAPFAALLWDGRRLIDELSLCVLPSAKLLATPDQRGSLMPPTDLLAVGINCFAPRELAELAQAEEEASEVAALSRSGRVLPAAQATKAKVAELLAKARWAHFATHADFNLEAPHASRLHLASDGSEQPWLTVGEIARSHWDGLRGVVMSACTASVHVALPGQELVGFPSGWLHAGVPHVLAPIWEVHDAAGRRFMKELYEQLERESPAQALATVQRKWAASPDPEQNVPFRWAGFVHHGC